MTPDSDFPEPSSSGKEKRVPILLDTAFTVGKLIMVGSTAAVIALSINAHCDALWVAIRAGVTLIVTGLSAWAVCWIISRGALMAVHSQLQEARQVDAAPAFLNKRV